MSVIKMLLLSCVLVQSLANTHNNNHNNNKNNQMIDRHLSEDLIAGYQPRFDMSDHLAIDLDQKKLESHLSIGDFETAEQIYNLGGFSKSVAALSLSAPLSFTISSGTKLRVDDANSNFYFGTASDTAEAGESTLLFLYNPGNCQMGGIPSNSQVTERCLPAGGVLQIAAQGQLNYTYDPATQNTNERTLAGFSIKARETMHDCGVHCPYATYAKFTAYYENFEYSNEFVMAGFEARQTSGFQRGSMDFSDYDDKARAEVIEKSTAYLGLWMYVIREMEVGLDLCQSSCTEPNCNDEAIKHFDEAVAFYVGSLEGSDGQGDGVLLHALADKRCQNFKTCLGIGQTAGLSKVNSEIMRHFSTAQTELANGLCIAARSQKESIEKLMAVPLIQGTLRYAWITDFEQATSSQAEEAEGAIFAASVLPLVHACSPSDAEFIYDNMRAGFGDPDFKGVKQAFERNYKCLGITCADVGGLWDNANDLYLDDASPCGTSGNRTAAIVGGVLGGICGALILVIVWLKFCRRDSSGKDNSFVAGEEAISAPAAAPPPPPVVEAGAEIQ